MKTPSSNDAGPRPTLEILHEENLVPWNHALKAASKGVSVQAVSNRPRPPASVSVNKEILFRFLEKRSVFLQRGG